ncbi:MAG: carboxypeptidase-like regulatory domain-containing protein [Proteobacteria bacterium]|nr:carboxypeptidase-like regulatory domain-containing protein [Pseudomonadota bacterium]MBU1611827.1 carboxypeptidase-like regulatory domain-containing protein [Pseudomonadota bacterium]
MKIRILATALLILLMTVPSALAGQYHVTGLVVAADNGSPLQGVSVSASETGSSASTNASGRFTLDVTTDKPVTLQFFLQGYRTVNKAIDSSTSAIIVSMQKTN